MSRRRPYDAKLADALAQMLQGGHPGVPLPLWAWTPLPRRPEIDVPVRVTWDEGEMAPCGMGGPLWWQIPSLGRYGSSRLDPDAAAWHGDGMPPAVLKPPAPLQAGAPLFDVAGLLQPSVRRAYRIAAERRAQEHGRQPWLPDDVVDAGCAEVLLDRLEVRLLKAAQPKDHVFSPYDELLNWAQRRAREAGCRSAESSQTAWCVPLSEWGEGEPHAARP